MNDAHLCAFRFDPGVAFEGGVIAAIERMQLIGGVKVLDGLFVARDPDSGALAAVDLDASGASKSLAGLLDFRLDERRREELTNQTLDAPTGVSRETIEAVGATVPPGGALVALLLSGAPPDVLEEAVTRMGGYTVTGETVAAATLGEVDLPGAVRASRA